MTTTPSSLRRCPNCRAIRPPADFHPITPNQDGQGIAWRSCPACQHQAPLVNFQRVTSDGKAGGR